MHRPTYKLKTKLNKVKVNILHKLQKQSHVNKRMPKETNKKEREKKMRNKSESEARVAEGGDVITHRDERRNSRRQ